MPLNGTAAPYFFCVFGNYNVQFGMLPTVSCQDQLVLNAFTYIVHLPRPPFWKRFCLCLGTVYGTTTDLDGFRPWNPMGPGIRCSLDGHPSTCTCQVKCHLTLMGLVIGCSLNPWPKMHWAHRINTHGFGSSIHHFSLANEGFKKTQSSGQTLFSPY